MGLPHLLLVDDSDAILNFEKAVLSGLYRLSTAGDGMEALEKIKQLKPDGVLLDLSMPRMDGDEVLKIIKADPGYSAIPFLVISSEKSRAEACLRVGADGILNKPILADELKARVALMLEAARESERKKSSSFLFLGTGTHEIGVPLGPVLSVHSQPATRESGSGSPFRGQAVDYYGERVEVLDLARVLGVEHVRALEDRILVFLSGKEKLALCVDYVWNPEELPPEKIHPLPKKTTAGADDEALKEPEMVLSLVESNRGLVPVLNPAGLFSESTLSSLAGHLFPLLAKKQGDKEAAPASRGAAQ